MITHEEEEYSLSHEASPVNLPSSSSSLWLGVVSE